MVSSVALRAQIASVIDALCKAAAAEIAKVVEDGMVVLRLEVCQRDREIHKLKSNMELLHGQLRAAQERLTRRPDDRGRDESQSDVGDARTLLDTVQAVQDPSSVSTPEVKVKREPVEEEGKESGGRPDPLGLYDGDGAQWLPPAPTQAGRGEPDFLNMGPNALLCLPESSVDAAAPCGGGGPAGFPAGPLGRGLLGHAQYRHFNNAARRRTAKRLMFKKGFLCPYCGKYFERAGHLERHKRIHTGEKPYRCDVCGRRFNQNSSLKEHTKIHRRNIQPRPVEIQVAEQKHVPEVNPCSDPHRPEEVSQLSAEDGLPKNEDVLSTPVQVKSEPVEENVTRPAFPGGSVPTMEGVDGLGENFAAFERDGQQWMSRLHGASGSEVGGSEYPGGSAPQSTPSFPGMTQLLPPPVEASCGTFSFPGKPHGELKNSLIAPTPYGSSDPLMMSGEAGLHGLAGAALNHHQPRAGWSFQVIKPKKSFVCSYCAKVFERAGHLERHLRIHTGEKPYGCHICGRCFNQKSSLKGHMKTHRNGENPDVLDASHMMFTIPDNQLLKNLAEPKMGPAAPEEQVPGSMYGEPAGEQTVVVKLEPNGDDFQTAAQAGGGENGSGAPDHNQLWTSGMDKSGDSGQQGVCLLFHDVKYHLSPVAGATSELQGYTSPIKDLPFLDHKEKEETLNSDQFAVMSMQPGGADVTLAAELQEQHLIQEVTVSDYAAVSDRPHEGGVFPFNMAAGDHEDGRGGADAARPNCFICSHCGQSFDSFDLFQRHRCADGSEPAFSCHTCGKAFDHMSVLKLHQKLHAE